MGRGDVLCKHLFYPLFIIQRAKKFYSSCEPRTKLLEWEMRGLEVMILADPTMHGKAEVVRHLKEFDCFSPWPSDSQLEFTTLWCRWIKVRVSISNLSGINE